GVGHVAALDVLPRSHELLQARGDVRQDPRERAPRDALLRRGGAGGEEGQARVEGRQPLSEVGTLGRPEDVVHRSSGRRPGGVRGQVGHLDRGEPRDRVAGDGRARATAHRDLDLGAQRAHLREPRHLVGEERRQRRSVLARDPRRGAAEGMPEHEARDRVADDASRVPEDLAPEARHLARTLSLERGLDVFRLPVARLRVDVPGEELRLPGVARGAIHRSFDARLERPTGRLLELHRGVRERVARAVVRDHLVDLRPHPAHGCDRDAQLLVRPAHRRHHVRVRPIALRVDLRDAIARGGAKLLVALHLLFEGPSLLLVDRVELARGLVAQGGPLRVPRCHRRVHVLKRALLERRGRAEDDAEALLLRDIARRLELRHELLAVGLEIRRSQALRRALELRAEARFVREIAPARTHPRAGHRGRRGARWIDEPLALPRVLVQPFRGAVRERLGGCRIVVPADALADLRLELRARGVQVRAVDAALLDRFVDGLVEVLHDLGRARAIEVRIGLAHDPVEHAPVALHDLLRALVLLGAGRKRTLDALLERAHTERAGAMACEEAPVLPRARAEPTLRDARGEAPRGGDPALDPRADEPQRRAPERAVLHAGKERLSREVRVAQLRLVRGVRGSYDRALGRPPTERARGPREAALSEETTDVVLGALADPADDLVGVRVAEERAERAPDGAARRLVRARDRGRLVGGGADLRCGLRGLSGLGGVARGERALRARRPFARSGKQLRALRFLGARDEHWRDGAGRLGPHARGGVLLAQPLELLARALRRVVAVEQPGALDRQPVGRSERNAPGCAGRRRLDGARRIDVQLRTVLQRRIDLLSGHRPRLALPCDRN